MPVLKQVAVINCGSDSLQNLTRKMEVPNRIPNICASISLLLPLLVHV